MRPVGGTGHRDGMNTPPRMTRAEIGALGEQLAVDHLISLGMTVLVRNWRCRWGELDIIATERDHSAVVFVEVKTRRSTAFGLAAEAVGWRKQRTLSRVAELWRLRFGRPGDTYRFDLVSVTDLGSGRMDVEHLPDAWRLERRSG